MNVRRYGGATFRFRETASLRGAVPGIALVVAAAAALGAVGLGLAAVLALLA